MTCVTYLSFHTFGSGWCQTDKEFEERLQLNPLYEYAARNWGHYAHTTLLEVEQSILEFFRSEGKVAASVQALLARRINQDQPNYSQHFPRQMIGVHLAAYFGLTGVMMTLLKNGHYLDVEDGWSRTPFS